MELGVTVAIGPEAIAGRERAVEYCNRPVVGGRGRRKRAIALYQRILNVVVNPRPFVQTKDYFGPDRRRTPSANYVGPERRSGGDVEVIEQAPLYNKARGAM